MHSAIGFYNGRLHVHGCWQGMHALSEQEQRKPANSQYDANSRHDGSRAQTPPPQQDYTGHGKGQQLIADQRG